MEDDVVFDYTFALCVHGSPTVLLKVALGMAAHCIHDEFMH
jgi:hypothetical protein